jgi:PAS domain S-box-containing protein
MDEVSQLRRRIAELERTLADDEYRYSVELNPQVAWMAGADGRIEDFNQRWLDLTGLTREQALGHGWKKVVAPEDLDAMVEVWTHSIETGEPYDLEHRIRLRDGSLRWMRSRALARRNARGEIARWYGSTEDIHDRKEAELLLKNSEQMFGAAFKEAPIGMVLLSVDGTVLEVNQAYREMLGYGTEDLAGKDSAGITHPDDIELTKRFFEHLQSGGVTKSAIEKRYFHRDGRLIWARASATMRRDAEGRPMQVVAIVEDISERKHLETILRESEERLQLIFKQAPVGVCVLKGHDLVFELVNPHYQELIPGRNLLGRALLDAVPEVDAAVLGILRGPLETGEPIAGTEFLIPLDQNGDGEVEDCWFNFVCHPLRDRRGDVWGVVVIAIDVSSHVRARVELQRVNRELEEFAYVASHDLQEPLRMVNIYTQLLLRELKPFLTEKTTGFAGHVQAGVARMEQLLRDLLNFSKTIADESSEERCRVSADLHASACRAIETLQGQIEEAQAVVSLDPLPVVFADHAQMTQVFQNLISNALKYRNEEERPNIRISCRSTGKECVVVIADNGIGFSQNQAERIFGLFKRLHNKNKYPGTGLGLAICKRIVERYGGRIWAESDPGKGAMFFFSLKQAEIDETAGHTVSGG